jgi:MoaA/NifB/PqqE/SkfB family radical SAM enzyme
MILFPKDEPMTPEIRAQYNEASRPYIEGGGAITLRETSMMSWRYFLEINSACNLACPTCAKGNKEGYEHQTGIMDWDLMLKCIEKIKNENNQAIVLLYGNSEPFLHPRLAECIKAVKAQGLRCEISTNLNTPGYREEFLNSGLDFMIISVSGFTQEIYARGHAGGKIERVKENMRLLSEARARVGNKFPISVNYHVYNDNEHEIPLMKAYAESLGFGFFTSFARAISMENTLQYLRMKEEGEDGGSPKYDVQPGKPDWNLVLPPVCTRYIDAMNRLKIPPQDAIPMYQHYPVMPVCPVGDMFTFIRHDGKVSLCACVSDRRLILGDYLSMSQEELSDARRGHAICKLCLKYRMNLYFHIVDREKWEVKI